jgi:hypothetical protein
MLVEVVPIGTPLLQFVTARRHDKANGMLQLILHHIKVTKMIQKELCDATNPESNLDTISSISKTNEPDPIRKDRHWQPWCTLNEKKSNQKELRHGHLNRPGALRIVVFTADIGSLPPIWTHHIEIIIATSNISMTKATTNEHTYSNDHIKDCNHLQNTTKWVEARAWDHCPHADDRKPAPTLI